MDRRTPPHVRLQHLLRTLPLKRGADKAHRLLEISDLWGFQTDYDEAHAAAAAAFDVATELDSDHLRARALAAKAKANRHRDNDEEAMMDEAAAADLFSSLAEWEAEISSRIDIAASAINLGMYCEARDQASKALSIAESLAEDVWIGRACLCLARALSHLDQNTEVLEYASRARTLLHGEALSQSLACDLIGEAHIALGSPDQALHYLEQSMVLMEAVGRGEPVYWERIRFGSALRAAGRHAEAGGILVETLEILSDWDPNLIALGRCHLELAKVRYETDDQISARVELHQAVLLLEVSGTDEDMAECQRLKSELGLAAKVE